MPPEQLLSPTLLAIAAGQRGVFSAEQAYRCGHNQKEIQRLRRARQLHSVRRGVYVVRETYANASLAEQHRMRVGALALALSAPAVLSHQTAAAEHGLELLEADYSLLHVTRPDSAGTRDEAGVKHHAAELPPEHVVRRQGEPDLTALARTAVDVARETDRFESAVAVFDSALRLGVPRDELEAAMERCRSWPGARMASGAITMADGRAANPGESWSRVVLVRLGLAPLDLQVPIHDEEGLVGYADFGWDGVVGELDGRQKYAVPPAASPADAGQIVWLEKRREDRIRDTGLEVVRWTYGEHHRPEVIGAKVRRALARVTERRRATR